MAIGFNCIKLALEESRLDHLGMVWMDTACGQQ